MRRRTIHSIIMLVLLIAIGLVAIFKPEIFIKIQYWQLRDVNINTKTLLIYRGDRCISNNIKFDGACKDD